MCDACNTNFNRPSFNRRALLRGALYGVVGATTAPMWLPGEAGATDGTNGLEAAAMAEDSPSTSGNVSSSAATGSIVATRVIPSPNPHALSAPPIRSRKQWGANESIRVDTRSYAPVRKLIVHHTASANKPSNPAQVVRFVDVYHTTGRGFSDTGYNYLIDHKGVIYEGRAARRYRTGESITGEDGNGWGVVGAHAKNNNAGSCGICLIGNFDLASPTDAAVTSLVALLSWKASEHRIDATASEPYIDVHGARHVYPNISGHRQVGQTACPGSHLFGLLPQIRRDVASRVGSWKPLLVDIPGVLRREVGVLRAPSSPAKSTGPGSTTAAHR